MTKLRKLGIRMGLSCLMGMLLFATLLRPQRAGDAALEMTTQERLETEAWWPTMSNAPLQAYAGSESCGRCHTEGAQSTAMRRAAEPGADARWLKGGSASLEAAPHRYRLASTAQGLELSVADGDRRLTQKMNWSFGAGDLAHTFLYQKDGRWLQSEVSFYSQPAALDITTGLGRSAGPGLPAALGQPLSQEDARSCFGCHTVHATTSAGLEPLHAEAGLGCEACHGPARAHELRLPVDGSGVFDPSRLSPSDSIDFCGACHRSSADAKLSVTQTFGMSVIRFQPYRLQESKCWLATKDQRLTCVACHNPHQPLVREDVAYDKHCLECHTTTAHATGAVAQAKVCPKAAANCVSCHMPKVAVPTMHGAFTDHYIRIARAGEPLPR